MKPSGLLYLLLAIASLLFLQIPAFSQAIGLNDYRITTFGTNGDATTQAINPSIAYCSGTNTYLVVWSGIVAGEYEIYGRILQGLAANPTGSIIQISNMGPSGTSAYAAVDPAVAGSDSEFFVVWSADDNTAPLVDNEFEIYGQRIDASTGDLIGGRIRISDMGPDGDANFDANSPAIVYNSTGNSGLPEYLVVWSGDDNTGSLINDEFEIYIQRLSVTGDASGFANDVRISDMGPDGFTETQAFLPDVAWNSADNQYMVVWHGDDVITPLVDNELEIFMQRLTSTGAETGLNDIRVSAMGPNSNTAYGALDPSIAYNSVDNNYLIVWHADHNSGGVVDNEIEIYGQIVSNAGATGTTFRVSDMGPDGSTLYYGVEADVAHDPNLNLFLVSWYGDDNTGTLVDNEFEVYGQVVSGLGAETGSDIRLSDSGGSGTTASGATKPSVVYNSPQREFVVVWDADDTDVSGIADNEFEIFGQRYAELSPAPAAQPATPQFSSITESSFTVSFTAAAGSPDGYLVLRRTDASPTGAPADHSVYTAGNGIGDGEVVHVGSELSFDQSGLSANTTYHFDFFSYNGVQSSTNYMTSTPLEASVTTLASQPGTQASAIAFTSAGTNSIILNFTNGNGSSRTVVARAGSAVNNFPQDGTTYTANNGFGSGSNLGSGNFVVATGDGPVTVTGLSTATTYHFRVFESNGSGAQINYNTGTASDNPSSASTLSTQPSGQPTSLIFSDITSSSMDVSFTAASGSPSGYIVLRKAGSSPTDAPVDGQSYTDGATIGSSTVVFSGSGTSFTSSGLSAATTYHYDVFAFNGSGANRNYLTASPLEDSQITRANEPSAQPTSLSFSAVTPTSMDGSFTAATGDPDGYLIIRRTTSSPTDIPEDGTSYSAGNNLGSSHIVAVGSSTSFASTGLSPETEYYYDVFAFNGSGSTLNYLLTSPLEGYQTTFADEPSSAVSDIVFSDHTTNSFSVSFTDAAAPVDGYLVVRKTDAVSTALPADGISYTGGVSTFDGDPVVYIGSAPSFEESGLSSGTSYHYSVFPFNGAGNAVNYHTSGTTNKGFTVTLPAAPAVEAATDIAQTSFTAHWTQVNGAVTYELDVSPDDFTTLIPGYDAKSLTTNSEDIAGLDAGTTYRYRVRAINAIGGTSAYSDPVGVQLTVPPTPANVTISEVGQSQMSIDWAASHGATEYLLYISENASFDPGLAAYGPKALTVNSESVTGLTPGNTYHIKLQAKNDGGGPPSPASDVLIQLMISATPLGTDAVNVTSNSFKAKWDAANGASEYEIDVSLQNDFSSHVSGYPKNVGNTLEESVTGLSPSTTCFYTIRGKNATGFSPFGNVVSVTTTAPPGGSPLSVTEPLAFVPAFPVQLPSTSVGVQVTGGSGDKTVTLHHRPIMSTESYSTTQMTLLSGSNWTADLPATALDEIGVEFYVRAADASGSDESGLYYIYKAITEASNQFIPFQQGFNGKTGTYQMFSIPYELLDKDVENLFDVALGGYDNTKWRMFHYQGGTHREYPNQFVELRLGEAYWFNTVVRDFQIRVGEGSVALVKQTQPFIKTLEAGWNQIGNPFPFNISWDAVAGSNDKVGSLWFFNNGAYTKSDVLRSWAGAFVHADEAMTLEIPVSAKTTASGRINDELGPELDAAQWLLPLTLRIDGLQQTGGVGMHPEAKESKDRFDEITIPRFVDYAELNSHHREFFSPDFSTDVVPTKEEQAWVFQVESNLDGGVGEITWNHSAIAGNRSSLIMIDVAEGKWLDMKATGRYTFTHRAGRQLKIIYNREGEINPGMTLIGEAYPNPFEDEVHIPLLIGEPGFKQIEVYDGFGRMIGKIGANFESTGLHELTWNIKDDHPRRAGSGMMYFRLTGDLQNKVTRMIKH